MAPRGAANDHRAPARTGTLPLRSGREFGAYESSSGVESCQSVPKHSQRADLMDYGSLYGMGSYFGEDYTASNLVRLGTLTEGYLAQDRAGKPLSALAPEDQEAVKAIMQKELQ